MFDLKTKKKTCCTSRTTDVKYSNAFIKYLSLNLYNAIKQISSYTVY